MNWKVQTSPCPEAWQQDAQLGKEYPKGVCLQESSWLDDRSYSGIACTAKACELIPCGPVKDQLTERTCCSG